LENIDLIIKGCIAKEYICQKMVYRNYQGFAMKLVFRYIYRHEQVVDVVNDGFVKLFNGFKNFKLAESVEGNRKKLMGYIKRIMINTAIDELRKGNMSPEIGGIPEYVWGFTARDQDADQQILYKEVISMIKELPPAYRIVFNMYEIDGFNHLEIADILQIPVGTSKSNLSRAKSILQDKIKKSEEINYAVFR
jgi:RNA polymerase sigma-70 factor (ECF subfamily)